MRIFHLAEPDTWARARSTGSFTMSTRSRALEEEGFIHCSQPQQVSLVLDAVYADLEGDPNFWDKATIDSNVFAKFDESRIITTDFDKASVMIYTVPSHWTTDGRSFMPSSKLSDGDAATIRKLYA